MKLPKPDARRDILVALRNKKMARSPHAYVRGNTSQYYDWLHGLHGLAMPQGPAIWICGDCHLGNLGPLAGASGRVEMRMRDFDQCVVGNPAHDLMRLALSLATAARGSSLPGIATAHMMERLIEGYEAALGQDAEAESAAAEQPALVRSTLRGASKRSWKHLARERIEDIEPVLPLGRTFWPLSDAEHKGIRLLFGMPGVVELVTALKHRDDDARIDVLDAAYWVKGCSSLGLLRYAVLLKVGEEHCLIDIKEAAQAAAVRYPGARIPRDNAKRVVEGARNLSPALGKRMSAQRLLDHGVFVRELMPQDLKLEIDELSVHDSAQTARYLGYVVGQAHARQMDTATRKDWLRELQLDRVRTLAMPGWLWKGVIDLVANHERGYLEHCRRYALHGKR